MFFALVGTKRSASFVGVFVSSSFSLKGKGLPPKYSIFSNPKYLKGLGFREKKREKHTVVFCRDAKKHFGYSKAYFVLLFFALPLRLLRHIIIYRHRGVIIVKWAKKRKEEERMVLALRAPHRRTRSGIQSTWKRKRFPRCARDTNANWI